MGWISDEHFPTAHLPTSDIGYRKYRFWNAYQISEIFDSQYTIIEAFGSPQHRLCNTFWIMRIGSQEAEILPFETFEIILSPLQEVDKITANHA